jgi:hypothetical protein
MARDIERLLDECLFQLNSGDADLETVLAQHPEQADILRPMLKAALMIRDAQHPTPSPVAKSVGKQRLMMAVAQRRQERERRRSLYPLGRASGWLARLLEPSHPMRRLAVGVATVVFMFMLSGLSVSRVAARSLPDSPLYPIKLATEQVQLVLAPSPAERARLHIEFGQRRIEETQALAQTGGDVDRVVLAMIQQNKQAFGAIAQTPTQQRAPLLADLAELTRTERHALSELKQQLPPASQRLVSDAIAFSAEDQARAEEARSNPALAQLIPTAVPLITARPPTQTPVPPTATAPVVAPKEPNTDKPDRVRVQPPAIQPTQAPTLTPEPTKTPVPPSPTSPPPTPTRVLPSPTSPPPTPTLVPTRQPDVGEPREPKPTARPTRKAEPTAVQQPTEQPTSQPTVEPPATTIPPDFAEPTGTPVPLP